MSRKEESKLSSIYFEEISKDTLYISHEIINSNPSYNILENGKDSRSLNEIEVELINHKTVSMYVKLDDTYIGVIDYIMNNPKDGCPWIGLFMIHHDYQGYGFGTQAYLFFEKEMMKVGKKVIRIGVIKENKKALNFWKSLDFKYINMVRHQELDKDIVCLEKSLLSKQ